VIADNDVNGVTRNDMNGVPGNGATCNDEKGAP
jgi:hypothetical protein